jgi:hypothetical protein
MVAGDIASGQTVPLPRPRPATADPAVVSQVGPSACRLRLTAELAIAPSIPALDGPGECAVADVVRLEAVVLPDGSRVAVAPPATLRCEMAEVVVRWVREDVAAAVHALGSPLRSIDNYASYHCRSRNNIVGAQLSEHGKANALDVRSLRLANGRLVGLTDPDMARGFRESMRRSACARFSTVLGPGSDGYHENHVHVDLRERPRGRFTMCQWDVRDPEPAVAAAEVPPTVPLPPPRPKLEARAGKKL